ADRAKMFRPADGRHMAIAWPPRADSGASPRRILRILGTPWKRFPRPQPAGFPPVAPPLYRLALGRFHGMAAHHVIGGHWNDAKHGQRLGLARQAAALARRPAHPLVARPRLVDDASRPARSRPAHALRRARRPRLRLPGVAG